MAKKIYKKLSKAFTLIELLIGLAVSSLVLLAIMVIFSTGLDLSALFHRTATTSESMAESV
jgi:prepilin-type N-terminal cleavage/methylation domain-containing protein